MSPPRPARAATPADRALLRPWFAAFAADIGQPPPRDDRALDERIAQGRCTRWEDGEHPVSMAGITPTLSGTARVAPVHTPPERRGRGHAGAATAALSAAARASGVTGLLLFTTLANPTSNALYQRIGYRAVEDHVVIQFGTERAGGAEDAEGTRGVVEAQPSRGEERLPTSAQPPVHPNGCRQLAVAGVLS
ncbi:GNAT family N-acetyltransferase [Streptomyces sp. HJ7]